MTTENYETNITCTCSTNMNTKTCRS